MISISGFTYVYNAIEGGYPIVEAIRAVQPYVNEVVVVDMQSTDGTREVVQELADHTLTISNPPYYYAPIRIVNGYWGNEAEETLRQAHSNYVKCTGDVIVFFEADEVYGDDLIRMIANTVRSTDITDIAVYRIQLEQNFQRCRWYPDLVHRVHPNINGVRYQGNTTNRHNLAHIMPQENGLLWDVTYCFRDNWQKRIENNAHLWHEEPQYRMTPLHFMNDPEMGYEQAKLRLGERHWTWAKSPFAIPRILKPLVGQTKYMPRI
jgi:glycosyltransferase involved in cell wall biosynthesis